MEKPKILVTGAAGKTGTAVVESMLQQGWPVRAFVRRIDARSRHLEKLGAEIFQGDAFDPDQVRDALAGVRRAYYVPIFSPYASQAAMVFALAARESRLEAIVQLSQWISHRAHPSILTRETWLIDKLFATLPNVAHVIINPGMFADNFLRLIDYASLLYFYPVLTGDSRCAPVATEDIARVVTAVLQDPDRHHGNTYRPTGPKLLSGRDMASIIAHVVGHRVFAVDLPFGMFLKAARMTHADIHEIYNYREYLRDHHRGAFSIGGGVTHDVRRLTGSEAEDFETTARRYANLPFARQSLKNRLAAFVRFNLMPFYPGYKLDAYARRMQFPVPPHPSLASEDAQWLREHAGSDHSAPQVRAGSDRAVDVDATLAHRSLA